MVLQDTWLFHGTVYESLSYGKEGATMEEVVKAGKAAHMLLLDEATSTVDTRTEIQIQKAMRNLMKNKTCFVYFSVKRYCLF